MPSMKDKVKKLTPAETKAAIETLAEIALLGDGIKGEAIDWIAIGKRAKAMANEAFKPKCKCCGKPL